MDLYQINMVSKSRLAIYYYDIGHTKMLLDNTSLLLTIVLKLAIFNDVN